MVWFGDDQSANNWVADRVCWNDDQLANSGEIEAMDVKLTYLHGVLEEEIYME